MMSSSCMSTEENEQLYICPYGKYHSEDADVVGKMLWLDKDTAGQKVEKCLVFSN